MKRTRLAAGSLVIAAWLSTAPAVHAQDRDLILEPGPGTGERLDLVDLIRATNPQQEFNVFVVLDDGRATASEGETVRFMVRSEREGYVTLLSQNREGKVTLLYPNRWSPSKQIEASDPVYFPGSEMDFRIRVSAPFGTEYIKALVTPEPLINGAEAQRFFDLSPLLEVDGPPSGGGSDDLGGQDIQSAFVGRVYIRRRRPGTCWLSTPVSHSRRRLLPERAISCNGPCRRRTAV